jgi:hypothetical protein
MGFSLKSRYLTSNCLAKNKGIFEISLKLKFNLFNDESDFITGGTLFKELKERFRNLNCVRFLSVEGNCIFEKRGL